MRSSATVPPADFAVRYHWAEGSVPPPYHYEYDIELGPHARGQIVFRPDYPGANTPEWMEAWSPAAEAMAQLYTLLSDKQILSRTWSASSRQPVGGSSDWLEVTANGRQVIVPSNAVTDDAAALQAVYDAVRAQVPSALWEDLRGRREQYERDHLAASR